ncbi:MAG TPA: discoidin domain-containing protein [Polyangiaceae bacterium]
MRKEPLGSSFIASGATLVVAAALPLFVACSGEETPPVATGGSATGGANTGGSVSGGAPTGGVSGTPATGGTATGGVAMGGSTATGGSAGASAGTGGGGAGGGGANGGGAGGGAGSGASSGASGAAGSGAGMGAGGAAAGAGAGGAGAGGMAGGAGGKAGGGSGGMIAVGGSGSYVRTGWTGVYTCTGGACPPQSAADTGDVATNAFDGNYNTRWSTGVFQSALSTQNRFPLYFTVDMKQVTNVSRITTHPGCKDIFDSPGTIEVYLSIDGQNFGTAVTTMPHTPAVPPNGERCPPMGTAVATDSITFPTTAARYIQLKGTRRTTSDRYWAIGELYVYP